MDDFLYNLRKSIKDKRKDRNRRTYDNSNYRGVERRTGADRRVKKPVKSMPSNTGMALGELIVNIFKEPLESMAQSQKRIADASDQLLGVEERKIKALDRIAAVIHRMADPAGVPQDEETAIEDPIDDSADAAVGSDSLSDTHGLDPAVSQTIYRMRNDGTTFKAIANHLNEINAPTFSGRGRWHAQAVSRYYRMSDPAI